MGTDLTVKVGIGAVIRNTLKSAVGGASATIARLGDAISPLQEKLDRVTGFQKLKAEVKETAGQLKSARSEVDRLSREIESSEKPTKEMRQAFKAADRESNRLERNLVRQRGELLSLSRAMKDAGQSTRQLAEQQAELERKMAPLARRSGQLQQLQAARTANLARRQELRGQLLDAVALGAALQAPIRAAVNFESAMADVKKVVDFKTPDGFVEFGKGLRQMSRDIPLLPDQLAAIAAAGGQLGIKEDALPKFVTTTSKMAVAFDMSAEQAGESAAKMANVFQLPIENIEGLGDVINHLSDNTAAKASDMVNVLTRIGGTARQFGLSASQAAALGNAMVALGRPAEVAATGINAMLLKLQTAEKQGKKFQGALQSIGLSATEVKQHIEKDAQGAITTLLERLQTLDKTDRAGALTDLFGLEYADDISLLVGSLDEYRKALRLSESAADSAGSMNKEFANRSATTANQLALLRNNVVEMGVVVGSHLLPPLNSLVGTLRVGITTVSNLAERYPTLTKVLTIGGAIVTSTTVATIGLGYAWTFAKGGVLGFRTALKSAQVMMMLSGGPTNALKTTVIGLGTRVAAIGPVITGFGAALRGLALSAIPAVLGALKAVALFMVTNPIGLAITAIGVAAALIYANWEKVGPVFERVWKRIRTALAPAGEWLKENLLEPAKRVMELVGIGSSEKSPPPKNIKPAPQPEELGTTKTAEIPVLPQSPVPPPSMETGPLPIGTPNIRSSEGSSVVNIDVGGIVVQAAPGMDESALARKIRAVLEEMEVRARSERRAELYG